VPHRVRRLGTAALSALTLAATAAGPAQASPPNGGHAAAPGTSPVLTPFRVQSVRVVTAPDGALAALGTVTAVGNETASAQLLVSFYNAAGAVVASKTTVTEVDDVAPGATSDFGAFTAAAGAVRADATVVSALVDGRHRRLPLSASGIAVTGSTVSATITNTSGYSTASGLASVWFDDAVGVADVASLAVPALAPGASASVSDSRLTGLGGTSPAGFVVEGVQADAVQADYPASVPFSAPTAGGAVTVRPTLTDETGHAPLVGKTIVVLQRNQDGSGVQTAVARGTTSGKGTATISFTLRPAKRYTLRFDGDGVHAPTTFSDVTVPLHLTVSAQLAKGGVRRGRPFTIKGSVSRSFTGDKVKLERRKGRDFVPVRTASVNRDGTYSFAGLVQRSTGTYGYHVELVSTTLHDGASSRPVTVTVR